MRRREQRCCGARRGLFPPFEGFLRAHSGSEVTPSSPQLQTTTRRSERERQSTRMLTAAGDPRRKICRRAGGRWAGCSLLGGVGESDCGLPLRGPVLLDRNTPVIRERLQPCYARCLVAGRRWQGVGMRAGRQTDRGSTAAPPPFPERILPPPPRLSCLFLAPEVPYKTSGIVEEISHGVKTRARSCQCGQRNPD